MKHNWEYKRLEEVCKISPFPGIPQVIQEKSWLLNLDKIQSNNGHVIEYEYFNPDSIDGSVTKFNEQNVLFSKLRPNLNKVVVPEMSGYCTTELVPLFPEHDIDRYFLAYYLRNPHFVAFLVDKVGGAKMPRVKMNEFWKAMCPVPPMEIQKQIVAELDKLNGMIATRKEQLKVLDNLAQSLFYNTFGDPISNPKGWPQTTLGAISEKISNGCGAKIEADTFKSEGIAFFRCQNVWKNHFDYSDMVYVDDNFNTRYKSSSLKHNDLIVTKIGRLYTENSSLGRVSLFQGEDYSANLSGNLSFIRLLSGVSPKFVLYIMISDCFKCYVRNTTSGGIDKRALNNSQLKAFSLYLPPLELQNKFASQVEAIERQKELVEASISELQTLLDSRMDYWFN